MSPTSSVAAANAFPIPDKDQQYRKWQMRALVGVTFCYLFYYTGRQTFGFAIPGIQAELGLSKQQLGWVSAALLWGYAGGQSINGNLGDKLGGRRMMVLGAILSFAANWVMSFSSSFLMLLIVWCANGYFQSMGFAPGSRLLSNWFGQEQRGFVYGIYIGFSGFSSVIAYVLPIFITSVLGLDWHWIFRLSVCFILLGATALWLTVCERPEDKGMKEPQDDQAAGSEHQAKDKSDGGDESSRVRYLTVLKNWRLYVTGLSLGCQNAARYALIVWVPVHLLGPQWKAGAGGIDPAWITVALPVGMALGAISNSWVSDVVFKSKRYLAIVTYMCIAACVALTMLYLPSGNVVAGLPLLFLCGFFVFGPASSFWALCPDIFGRRMSGTATGLLNCMSYACAGLGEPMIGGLMDITGNTSLIFAVVAVLSAASALFALLIRR